MRSFKTAVAASLFLLFLFNCRAFGITVDNTVHPNKTNLQVEVITIGGGGLSENGSVQLLANGESVGSTVPASDESGSWTIIETVTLREGLNSIAVVDSGPPVTSADAGTILYDPTPPVVSGVSIEPVSPVGPGVVSITVEFNEKMNTWVNPILTVTTTGAAQVYNVSANPEWLASDTEWKTYKAQVTLPSDAANGVATVGVASAQDDVGNQLEANPSAGSFIINTNQMTIKPRLVRPNPDRTTNVTRYISTLSPQFEWTSVSDARRYIVHIVEAGAETAPFPNVGSTEWPAGELTFEATSPWTVSRSLTNGTSYIWGITAYDNVGNVMTSETSGKFQISTTPLALVSPTDGTETNNLVPTFSWVPRVDAPVWKYDLDISKSPTFSPFHISSLSNLAGSSMTMEAIVTSQLTQEGTYYWRVRARDEYGNINSESETWRLAIDLTPPEPPVPISPEVDAYIGKTDFQSIEFRWTQVADAENYELQLDPEGADFTSTNVMTWEMTRGASYTSAAYTITTLNKEGDYRWRVLSVDKAGNKSNAVDTAGNPYFPGIPVRMFTIDLEPMNLDGVVTLQNPIDNEFTKEVRPEFQWQLSSFTNEVDKMELWVSDSKLFSATNLMTFEVASDSDGDYNFTPDEDLNTGILYWKIRALDKAGNYSNFSYYEIFVVDTTAPNKPSITSPASGTVLQSSSVTLKVQLNDSIGGSSTTLPQFESVKIYSVHGRNLVGDSGSGTFSENDFVLMKTVDGQYGITEIETTIDLDNFDGGNIDGPVKFVATAIDQAGNESAYSDPVNVIIDLQAPQITQLILTNDHIGSSSYTEIDVSGKILVSIEFSEPMDTTTKPLVQIQSESGIFLQDSEDLAAPNSSWSDDGISYTGIVTVPLGSGYDGLANIYVKGDCKDLAGRIFQPNPKTYMKYFRIDTAPKLDLKVFYNPTDERDLIISVKSSEILAIIPRLEADTGMTVSRPLVSDLQNDFYVCKYTLTGKEAGEIDITAYGTDLSNNVGKATTTFVIESLFTASYKKVVSADRNLSIDIQAGAAQDNSQIIILQEAAASGQAIQEMSLNKVSALYKAAADSVNASEISSEQAMERVSAIYNIGPLKFSLAKACPIAITADSELLAGRDMNKVGLYQYSEGKWRFLGREVSNKTVSGNFQEAGRVALFYDDRAPEISSDYPQEGELCDTNRPEITVNVQDLGAGIDSSRISFMLDGKEKKINFNAQEMTCVFSSVEKLSEGIHQYEISAVDNCDNYSKKVVVSFASPAGFGFAASHVYPNPADSSGSNIVYHLNQTAKSVEIRIYDKTGDRVKTFENCDATRGIQEIWWDLTNEDMDSVANGVYIVRIMASDGTEVVERHVKLAVVR